MFVYNIVLIGFVVSAAVNSAGSAAVNSVVWNLASISTCRGSEFTCLDGTCIRSGAVCDTYWDCPDGSDEASCYSSTNSYLPEVTVSHERFIRQSPCGLYQWRCADGTCIAVDRKCDGKIDCTDRSDEGLCWYTRPSVSGKCVLPPYPEHGTYVATNAPYATPGQRFENAKLKVTCEQGYGVVGNAVLYCLDGRWVTPIQKCVHSKDVTQQPCNPSPCGPNAICRERNGAGYCTCVDEFYGDPYRGCRSECVMHTDCPRDKSCFNNTCVDPCSGTCGQNTECTVANHAPSCNCLPGYTGNPQYECTPVSSFCRLDPDVSVHYNCQVPGTDTYRICNQFEASGTLVKPECNTPIYDSKDDHRSMTCQSNGRWNRIIKCKPACGRVTPDAEGLIKGGTEAIRGELPWHVAIYEKPTQRRNYYEQICGGSLVSNRIVISAAHCFWDQFKNEKRAASNYAVATAKLFREWDHGDDKDAQKSELKSIELPPRYQGVLTNFQHDIAVLILETPFVYYTYVRPVCLDLFDGKFNDLQLQVGNFGKIAGWGLTGENGPASSVLKVVQLPFVPILECIRITPQTFTENITGDKICAGYNNGTAAVCKGDSGGGLSFPEVERGTTTYYLRGVVSTAPRVSQECNVFTVTTFTEIYQHKDFINHFMSTTCTLPPYPEHGFYEVTGDPAAKSEDDAENLYLNVSCNHGHSVIGNNVVVCILGEWSARMPECVPICYLQEHPTVNYSCSIPGAEGFGACGEYVPVGTSVKPECRLGYYSPAAMPEMRCLDGTWDYVAQCTPECGRLSDNATTLPWHVFLNIDKNQEGLQKKVIKYETICGANIIGPDIVITGALCFWRFVYGKITPSRSYMVSTKYLGASSEEDKFLVKEVKVTDRFQADIFQDDIALVILSRAFTYSMKLHPVCLDFDYSFNKKQLQEGNLGTIGVFPYDGGEVTAEHFHPSRLQLQRIPNIHIRKCREIEPKFAHFLTGDKICAGRKNGTFICRGNGGSGVAFPEDQRGVVRYYLRGIVSTMRVVNIKSICDPTDFVALTEVYNHKDFIIEQLATSLPPRVMGWQETEDAL